MKKVYLIIPFILAVWGVGYGLPMHLIGDEESLIGGAIKMIQLKQLVPTLDPTSFSLLYYPPLIPYLYLVAFSPLIIFKLFSLGFSLVALQDYFVLNLSGIWLSARIFTALASVGIIIVVYKLTRLLLNKPAAYLASVLLSLSFFHVFLAHWAKHWIFTILLVYLTAYLALLLAKGHLNRYWLVGLVSGLAVGTSYLGLASIALMIAILCLYRQSSKVILKNILIAFIIGGLLLLFNLPNLLRDSALSGLKGKSFVYLLVTIKYFFLVLVNQEIVLLLLSLVSLLLWKRHKAVKTFIIILAMAYVLAVFVLFHLEARYVYFILPALSILAADSLLYFKEKLNSRLAFKIVIFLILLWPLASVVKYNYLLSVDDTREQAIEFIEQNIKDNSFILSSDNIFLTRSQSSLELANQYGRINSTERYLLDNSDRLYKNLAQGYNYQNLHFWDENQLNIETVESLQAGYFVVDYWQASDLTMLENELRAKGTLLANFSQSELDKNYNINGNYWVFNSILFKLNRLGPTVEIYKL